MVRRLPETPRSAAPTPHEVHLLEASSGRLSAYTPPFPTWKTFMTQKINRTAVTCTKCGYDRKRRGWDQVAPHDCIAHLNHKIYSLQIFLLHRTNSHIKLAERVAKLERRINKVLK
jgi:hypothetical protein